MHLAASALAVMADVLVSADSAFASVRGPRWVDLGGGELAELLAG